MAPRLPSVMVSPSCAQSLRRGHPWIFRDALRYGRKPDDVAKTLASLDAGAWVAVADELGQPLGHALLDPASPIVGRMWSQGDADLRSVLCTRIEGAFARRANLAFGEQTTAYRLLHGEGDRAPGLVLDRYADVAVLRLDGQGLLAHLALLEELLWPLLVERGVRSLVLRATERGAKEKIALLRGDPVPPSVTVREHGVPFLVDLHHGQKTGAFLDQRENRRRVGQLAEGRRVLNLFSYAGGFSLFAALGGATACTSVDIAASAHAGAERSFREAGLDPRAHRFVTADAWQFLQRAAQQGEQWDLIVSDPPNMAPNERSKPAALTSYRKLHAACARVLSKNGGIYCAASCSSHVGVTDFLSTLTDDVLGRSDLSLLELRGAGPDHPTLPSFPEGAYLQFAILA